MYNLNQYAKDTNRRARIQQEVQQINFADTIQGNQKTVSFNTRRMGYKLIVTTALAVLVILLLLLVPQTTNASDKLDPGEGDAFYDQMVAFRLGYYYYVTGEYERAVDYYNQAIGGLPEVVFTRVDTFRCMYWYLGDAQLKDGDPNAALKNYQRYLELVGDQANPVAVNFVQTLKDSITSGGVTPEPL